MTLLWHDNDNGANEADLQAYVDGQLEGRRRAEIEAYLASNPVEAVRLAAYRDQNIGLHALFDPLVGETSDIRPEMAALTARLESQLHETDSPPASSHRRQRHIAASVALLLAAGTAGWLAIDQAGWRDAPLVALTRQASDAPVQLATNNGQTETRAADGVQQVAGWLAAQTGDTPQQLPDLEAQGFELAAQRVIQTASGQPAAQLLYQDESGQRVTLYMRAGGTTDKTTFTFTRDGEASQFFWQDSHMAYSLVGKMPQEKLLRIAEAVNKSLRDTEAVAAPAPEAAAQPVIEPALQSDRAQTTAPATDSPASGGTPGQTIEQNIDPGMERNNPLPAPLIKPIEVPKET